MDVATIKKIVNAPKPKKEAPIRDKNKKGKNKTFLNFDGTSSEGEFKSW